jgi:hypothetical protein
VEPERAFSELGFDSLAAVGFRNKLILLTGRQLPASLIFDYPNALALARELTTGLVPAGDPAAAGDADERIREALRSIPPARLRDAGLLDSLLALAGIAVEHPTGPAGIEDTSIDDMDTDKLISKALGSVDFDDASREM